MCTRVRLSNPGSASGGEASGPAIALHCLPADQRVRDSGGNQPAGERQHTPCVIGAAPAYGMATPRHSWWHATELCPVEWAAWLCMVVHGHPGMVFHNDPVTGS